MAFKGKHSCYSFTAVSVRQNAPPCSGVYALSNASGWIYIAEADNMQAALMTHLSDLGAKLRTAAPTGFTFEPCEPGVRASRLARLIQDLSPSCNLPTRA